MRKVALFLAIILVISTPLTVSAAPRMLTINPTLAVNGTTAACEVDVVGNTMSEYIEVTMTLKRGTYTEATWYTDGYGYVYMLEYDTVTKGRTYELVVAVTVNGVAKTPVSVSGTC